MNFARLSAAVTERIWASSAVRPRAVTLMSVVSIGLSTVSREYNVVGDIVRSRSSMIPVRTSGFPIITL